MTRAVGKEYVSMFARSKRPSIATLQLFTFTSLALGVCTLSSPAWAQADQEGSRPGVEAPDDEGGEEEGEANKTQGAVGQTAQVETTTPAPPATATAADDRDPREPLDATDGLFRSKMKLGWDGNAEIDVGYARYGYSDESATPERFYDMRGRFVVGPVLEYAFDERHFFRANGQVVAWIREEKGNYQVNADDVYVQVGRRKSWDLKLGRFFAWNVYNKGLGFDLYTLEDTGALREGPFNQAIFGVDMYEVNAIYWREMANKLAFHVYPHEVLGFEVLALYGAEQTTNHIGARVAADLDLKFLRVRAGAEYRKREPTQEVTTLDATGGKVPCDKCSDRLQLGFGGGAIFSLGPVQLGANIARLSQTNYQTNGQDDLAGTFDQTTFGGYFEVDPGKLLFQRSLIVGVGSNRSQQLLKNQDFERHTQSAAYIAFPLGFNDAMIKLVVSKADLLIEDADINTGIITAVKNNDMVAGRVRVRFSF
jgi:hypothetical protein